jgi:hypothetical protein
LVENALPDNKSLTDMNTQFSNETIYAYFKSLIGTYILFEVELEKQIHFELEEVPSLFNEIKSF